MTRTVAKLIGKDLMLRKQCLVCGKRRDYPEFEYRAGRPGCRGKRGSVCARCRGVYSPPAKVGRVKKLVW